MTQAVREAIITPMLELYLPPVHLRADREAQGRAIATYERALGGFDRRTLERAWETVVARQTYWVWPNPGVIAEICRQCEPKPKAPSEEEQRQARAQVMTEEYASRYMRNSHVARLSRQEGWASELREYVSDAAWVQAQLICGVRNIGWNVHLSDSLGAFRSSQEAFQAYRETVARPVERGQIRVSVPRCRIQEWKEHCRQAVLDPFK